MGRLYRAIARRPKAILAATALLTALLAIPASRIRLDASVTTLLAAGDPEAGYHERIRREFGSDEVGVVAIFADDVYAPKALERIRDLSDQIRKVDGVKEVLSLTTAVDPVADVLDPPPLIESMPKTEADSKALRDKIADRPIYQRNLVSPDGRAAGINILFEDVSDDELLSRGTDDAIEAILERSGAAPGEIAYTGLPHFKAYSAQAMGEDLRRLIPVTAAIALVVLFACFRSFTGVVVPMLTTVVTVVGTLAVVVWSGGNLNLGTVALPPLVVVLATSYSLHVTAMWEEAFKPGHSREDLVFDTLEETASPVLIAGATTALGFVSLLTSSIPGIRELGIYTSVGIGFSCLLSLTFVPACLALAPDPRRSDAPAATDFFAGLTPVLKRVTRYAIRHRRAVITVAAMIVALSLWQARKIRVDTQLESFFPPDAPIRRDTDAVNQRLAGSMAFYTVVDGNSAGLLRKEDILRRMRGLQRFIEAMPGVDATVSFVDYAELLDRGSRSGSKSGDMIVTEDGQVVEMAQADPGKTLWEDPKQLDAVMQLVASSPKSFSRVVNADFSRAPILVRTKLSRSSEILATTELIKSYAARHFPPEVQIHPTGALILATRTASDLVKGEIQSLAVATVVIFLVLAAMFLSLRIGFMAMLPSLPPVAIFFGLMGILDIPLNLGTSIVGAISLGIVVDNTIHLMARLGQEVHKTTDQEEAMLESFASVGKPAVYTSLLLVLGFLALALSGFVPLRQFGVLSATAIVASMLGDLVLLPALLATTRIITIFDVLRLKLGAEPHRTIPLFAGLRPLQAKIVALMGRLQTFAPGQHVVRRGEVGAEMFVIIDGKAQVILADAPGGPQVLEFGRGDVLGEMGLVRHQERTADVIAATPLEVMSMDEAFLRRIQTRYPRIATKILLNVSRILSDRLQAQTERGRRPA